MKHPCFRPFHGLPLLLLSVSLLASAAGNRPRTPAAAQGQSIPLVYTQENSGVAYPAPNYPDFAHLPIVRQLPDPFVFADGTRDTSFAALDKHRSEWANAIATYEQGPKPLCTGDPAKDSVLGVGYTCAVSASWTSGTGQNRTIAVKVTVTPTATGVPVVKTFNVAVVLPTESATCVKPAAGWPIVVGMGSGTGSWPASAFNASTASPAGVTVKPTGCAATVNFPLSSIAVYGGSGVHATDLFYQLYPNLCAGKTSPSSTAGTCNVTYGFPNGANSGEYTAWAWGLSRTLDAIQQVAAQSPALALDTTHSATSGCSYAGKMALWTAALDERVSLAIAQENGGGGAPAWRISHELETQGSVENVNNTDYNWFATSTLAFSGYNVYKLPYDHHQLLALMAPRAVLETGNSSYYWLGDRSNAMTTKAAQQVWDALGISDRYNYIVDTNHSHCAVPTYQQNAAQPVINKFLFGTDTAQNNATLPVRVTQQAQNALGSGAQPTWDPTRWTAWWGTGNPTFVNGGEWNQGGNLVLPVKQSLTLNTGDIVSSVFQLTMPGSHAPATVTVPTSFTEVDVACTDGTSYSFQVPPPLPSTTAAGYPPASGSPSATGNPQTFTMGVDDNAAYPSAPNTAQNPGCSNGAPGKVTGAYFFALGKPNPGAGNPGLTGFSTTNGFQASGATDPLKVAVNLSNSTTGEGGAFTPWTTINRLNPYACTPPGCPLTPTLTWTAPDAITNGTPLSATQLSAVATSTLLSGSTVTGVGTNGLSVEVAVPGTFSYDPPLGTVLGAGMHTLNVTFTPTNVITASTTAANAFKTYTISKASVPIMVGTAAVNATGVLSKISGGYQLVITVKNNGNMTASNVQLTSAALGSAGATMPASLGNIASGGSASMTLTFPASAGASGQMVLEKLAGTYAGGSFGANVRAVLP